VCALNFALSPQFADRRFKCLKARIDCSIAAAELFAEDVGNPD
jgi:hypothetical protein